MRFMFYLILLALVFVGALLGAFLSNLIFPGNVIFLMIGAYLCAFAVFLYRNKILTFLNKLFNQNASDRK